MTLVTEHAQSDATLTCNHIMVANRKRGMGNITHTKEQTTDKGTESAQL